MPTPSLVIVLVEDTRHQQIVYNYLRRIGLKRHAIRIEKSPAGQGSAVQWVREQLPVEVRAYCSRQAQTGLIVAIDADTHTVQQRTRQLDQILQQKGVARIDSHTEQIARLVPKRNIETWILCLNEVPVDEEQDFKNTRTDWTDLIPKAAEALYTWTRSNAPVPQTCIQSLHLGIEELNRLKFQR